MKVALKSWKLEQNCQKSLEQRETQSVCLLLPTNCGIIKRIKPCLPNNCFSILPKRSVLGKGMIYQSIIPSQSLKFVAAPTTIQASFSWASGLSIQLSLAPRLARVFFNLWLLSFPKSMAKNSLCTGFTQQVYLNLYIHIYMCVCRYVCMQQQKTYWLINSLIQ